MNLATSVMVVEDDRDIRSTLQQLFELSGYGVVAASNGKEALEQLGLQKRPCVILLDLMMPVMDGWEFVRQKNAAPGWASIPVAVVSAMADRQPPQGVQAVFKKPLDFDMLLAFVEKHWGQKC